MLLLDHDLDALVLIVGHRNPEFLLDTANSIRFFNQDVKYDIAFAIDGDNYTYDIVSQKVGKDHAFITDKKNGWGRGILRTIIHAIDYFSSFRFKHLITIDSDALCVAPFIKTMIESVNDPDVFFAGTIWWSPDQDHAYHSRLRKCGFLSGYEFHFRTEMAAGPCMLWSNNCLNFMTKCGLLPGKEFDKIYPCIGFAHDQISTYLLSCGCGSIRETPIMELKWREPLPYEEILGWGNIPIIGEGISVIHPVASDAYEEKSCREYFRNLRYSRKMLI